MNSDVFACHGQNCLGQRAMSHWRWQFFPSLCQSRAPHWHFSPPNLSCASSSPIDVASLKTVCYLTRHLELFLIKFWRINASTFNDLNSWIIRPAELEQHQAAQSRLAGWRLSWAERQLVLAVISEMTLPVHAWHRADKTNSFHQEEKFDGGSERQFADHLKAAIKVWENYWEERRRQKLFCYCGEEGGGDLWEWGNGEN